MNEEIRKQLIEYGQEHLITAWEQLDSPEKKQKLLQETQGLDLELLQQLFQNRKHSNSQNLSEPEPLSASGSVDAPNASQWKDIGIELLKAGKAAAFLVAGGQGSRLGFEGPKGMYSIGLPSGKSLFQLQAERILFLEQQYQAQVPWYIMTSPLNHQATTEFFKQHDFFGLCADRVTFFQQGTIPALDENGKVLLEAPGKLALVPDGNGGCFRALQSSGCLEQMQKAGVEYLNLYSVDNALIKVCDPVFLGWMHDQNLPSASKVVSKASPEEAVGIFALQNKLPTVLEYSDISDDLRNARNADGSLRFDGANIAVHGFRVADLAREAQTPLPYHTAHKKVSCWDVSRQTQIIPDSPNAWKFEQFLFDIFPKIGIMKTFLVHRNEEFSPVKNAEGKDSPATAREMIGTLHASWLRRAGIEAKDKLAEISPTLSYCGSNLTAQHIQQAGPDDVQFFSEIAK